MGQVFSGFGTDTNHRETHLPAPAKIGEEKKIVAIIGEGYKEVERYRWTKFVIMSEQVLNQIDSVTVNVACEFLCDKGILSQ